MKHLLVLLSLLVAGTAAAQIPASGLRVHLKADAGTSTTTDGVGVTQWDDQSGNALHATSPGGSHPTFLANGMNGLPALRFAGGQYFALPTASALGIQNSDYEVFFVARSASSDIQFLLAGPVEQYELHLNGAAGQRFIPNTSNYIDNGANQAFTNGAARIFSARAGSDGSFSRVNASDASNSADGRSSADGLVAIGIRSGGGLPFQGDIAEVLVYDRILTPEERKEVERHLVEKYDIQDANFPRPVVGAPTLDIIETDGETAIRVTGTIGVTALEGFEYKIAFGGWETDYVAADNPGGTFNVDVTLPNTGLAFGTDYEVSIIARGPSGLVAYGDTASIRYVGLPVAVLQTAVPNPQYGATFTGTVDPNGNATTYRILYGTDPEDLTGATSPVSAGNGLDAAAFELELSAGSLSANQTYHVVLEATGDGGFVSRSDTLTLSTTYPTVAITSVTPARAANGTTTGTFEGTVNPNGSATEYRFLYGMVVTDWTAIGAGTEPVAISLTDTPLSVAETYEIILEARNAAGNAASDTTEADTYFADVTDVAMALDYDEGERIRIDGSVLNNGIDGAQYRIRFGPDRQSLPALGDFASADDVSGAFSVIRFLDPSALTPGTLYHAVIEAVGVTGKTTFSDTVSVRYGTLPAATITDVETAADLTATVNGTAVPNGAEPTLHLLYGTEPENLNQSVLVSAALMGVDARDVMVDLSGLTPRTVYHAAWRIETSGYPAQYSDTLSFDTHYVDIAETGIALRNDGGAVVIDLAAEMTLVPGEDASYQVFIGADGSALEAVADPVAISPSSAVFALDASIPSAGLAFGTTYAVVIQAVGHTGKVSRSDTLRILYRGTPQIIAFEVATQPDLSAAYNTTLRSNGTAGTYRIHYGTDRSILSMASDPAALPAATGDLDIADAPIQNFNRNETWYAAISIQGDGFDTVWSDTVGFNLNFATLSPASDFTLNEAGTLTGSVEIHNYDRPVDLSGRFGYANHPDSLVFELPTRSLSASSDAFWTNFTVPDVVRNDTVFVQLRVDNGDQVTPSAITSYITRSPIPVIGGAAAVRTGSTWKAIVTGTVDPNGMNTSYRILYSDSPDFESYNGSGDVFIGITPTSIEVDLEDLVLGTTYYAVLSAYDDDLGRVVAHSDTLAITFESAPEISSFALTPSQDLDIAATGEIQSNNQDLRYRVRYGTSADALTQATDWTEVTGTFDVTEVDATLSGLQRFTTVFAALEVEPDGGTAFRSDTLDASLNYAELTVGEPILRPDGGIGIPFAVVNGGLDAEVRLVYGTSAEDLSFEAESLYVAGSVASEPDTLLIPNPGVGIRVFYSVSADIGGVITVSDTLDVTSTAPEFTFDRAFARQDYKGVFEATVNPNGIPTFVRFDHGVFGSFNQSTTPIDIGSGTEPVAVQSIEADLYFNADHLVRMVVYGTGFSFTSDTLYFNARIPGIGINELRSDAMGEVTASVYINPQGITTFSRLVYGPVGGGFPDTTDAVVSMDADTYQTFDITIDGLTPLTDYQVKLLVQDQADLDKVVVSGAQNVTVMAGTPMLELLGLEIEGSGFDATYTGVARVNPMGQVLEVVLDAESPYSDNILSPYPDPLTGTEWIEIRIPIENESYTKRKAGDLSVSEGTDLLSYLPKGVLRGTYGSGQQVASAPMPYWSGKDVFFVTSTADTVGGYGQHGTLRYALERYESFQNSRSEEDDFVRKSRDGGLRSAFIYLEDLIIIAVKDTITLTSPLPVISHSIGILGADRDSTVLDGGGQHRILTVGSDSVRAAHPRRNIQLSIGNLTLFDGHARGADGVDGGGGDAGMGGALYAHVTHLNLTDVVFKQNRATGGLGSEVGPGTADGFVPYGAFGKGGAGASGSNTVPGGYGGFGAGAGANSAAIGLSGYGAGPATSTRGGDGAAFGGAVFFRTATDDDYIELNNVLFIGNTLVSSAQELGTDLFAMPYAGISLFGDVLSNGEQVDINVGNAIRQYEPNHPGSSSSDLAVTFIDQETARVSFDPGSGSHRLILMVDKTNLDDEDDLRFPGTGLDGTRYYASTRFGDPNTAFGTGYHIVYAGTGSSVDITGLGGGRIYEVLVFDYNDAGSGADVAYDSYAEDRTYTHLPGERAVDETPGQALRLEAADAPLAIGSARNRFYFDESVAIQLFVKPDALGSPMDLIGNGGFVLRITAEGAVEWVSQPGGTRDSIRTADGAVAAGRWNLVGIRANPTEQQILVNGSVLEKRTLASPAAYGGTSPITLGGGFAGLMDEIRILAADPTLDHLREALYGYVFSSRGGLTGYLQFNESEGDSTRNSASDLWIAGAFERVPSDVFFYPNGYLTSFGDDPYHDTHLSVTRTGGGPLDNPAPPTFFASATADPADVPTGHTASSDRYIFQPLDTTAATFDMDFKSLPQAMNIGNRQPNQYRLYQRPILGGGPWTLVAAEADAIGTGVVHFHNVSARGEFLVARDFAIDYADVPGMAVRLDGFNDHIEFPHTEAMSANTAYTLQMWFNTDDATRAVQFLTSKGNENREIHLSGNRSVRFIPRNGAYYDTAPNSIPSGEWTHISATFDPAAQEVKVYLNGVDMPLTYVGPNPNPFNNLFNISSPMRIGIRSDNGYPLLGEVDEIRMWNGPRTALQVLDDMRHTSPEILDNNLVLYAQLNEGSGNVLNGNLGVDGYLHNADTGTAWVTSTIPINGLAVYRGVLTGQAGWRLLASPVQTTVGELLSGIFTQGFEGATTTAGSPNVFTWNASNASNGAGNWVPVTSASQVVAPGDGLFAYVYETEPGGGPGFPKTLTVTGPALREATALGGRLNPNPDGWALVGNPFGTDIVWGDLQREGLYEAVYLWDANEDEWVSWNGSAGSLSEGRIGAFNAFFVATLSENPAMTAPFSARRAGPSRFVGKAASTAAAPSLSLKVESPDGRSNRAWFSFTETGEFGLDAFDAFKMAPFSTRFVQLASVIQDSIRLDINNLPMLRTPHEATLRLTGSGSGTYRISLDTRSLPEGWDLMLTDTETGTTSRLAEPMAFEWTGGATAETTRFRLTVSPTTITDIETGEEAPYVFALEQNYPNPFNPTTVIRWTLDAPRATRLSVYDLLGREVAVLADGEMPAGRHAVTFDGSRLASGVYLYRLQSGNQVLTRKFTLIK